MKANQATHSVGVMCRVLKISRSGYYAWLQRPMSARARQDLWLTGKIEAIHRRSRGAYGSPMIHAELADDHDIRIGRKRVARLMRSAGLRGVTLRRFAITTTPDPKASRAIDLVERRFYAEGPDRLWVADITYVPTWAGFLYLAVVMDVYSRRIVGWAMETHLRTELILSALEMALVQRRPEGVIHHSDRGCQPEFNRSSQQHRGLSSYHLVLVHSSAYALGAMQSDADASEGQVRFVARSFIVSPRRPDFNDPDLWSITPG